MIQNIIATPAAVFVYLFWISGTIMMILVPVWTVIGWNTHYKQYLRRKKDERTMRIGQKGIIVDYKQ